MQKISLHPHSMTEKISKKNLMELSPERDFNAGLSQMEHRRTSLNGYFGIQLHYAQFMDAFSSQQITGSMVDFLQGFDKLIWVRRRDRLRQCMPT